MSRIFVSYRRDDAAGHAGRLYDQLREDFGDDSVFMDVDAIEPGVDFAERIERAVESADVFIAVVGRNWASVTDAAGRRRLDDPDDYVRREVAAALGRPITVVPVLVGGATMPAAGELPAELAHLTRRNALVLSDLDWHSGARRLVAALEKDLSARERPPEPPPPRPRPRRREREARPDPGRVGWTELVLGLAGAGLVLAATALRWETLARPPFGGGSVPGLWIAVAPASIAVAAGALYAFVRAWRSEIGPLATGLLLGFSLGGLVKYGALLGRYATTDEAPAQWGSLLSLALGFGGSLLLAAVAAFWIAARHRREARFARVPGRVVASVGALLMLAATAIPFNVSFPQTRAVEQVIVQRDLWEALDPIALALAVVATIFLGGRLDQLVVSGLLVALGVLGALLWLRYIGVPALQMLARDDLASLRPGGAVGLAGSLLVWRAGFVAGRSAAAEPSAKRP